MLHMLRPHVTAHVTPLFQNIASKTRQIATCYTCYTFFKKKKYIYSFLKNGVTCVTCRVLLEFPYKTGVTCAVTCGRNMCNLSNILSFSVGKK